MTTTKLSQGEAISLRYSGFLSSKKLTTPPIFGLLTTTTSDSLESTASVMNHRHQRSLSNLTLTQQLSSRRRFNGAARMELGVQRKGTGNHQTSTVLHPFWAALDEADVALEVVYEGG
jgi:hypothetical protein